MSQKSTLLLLIIKFIKIPSKIPHNPHQFHSKKSQTQKNCSHYHKTQDTRHILWMRNEHKWCRSCKKIIQLSEEEATGGEESKKIFFAGMKIEWGKEEGKKEEKVVFWSFWESCKVLIAVIYQKWVNKFLHVWNLNVD